MQCEMCGANGNLVRAMVEGVEFEVCSSCAKHGKIIGSTSSKKDKIQRQAFTPKEVAEEMIVADFAQQLRSAREHMGLKQAELALRLNVKESLVQHMESGTMRPPIDLAKKLERFFKIQLVEMYEPTRLAKLPEIPKEVTIGDMIKIKTRKKK